MMKIVILNQKGGVGKSTITVNLGYGLARRGKKTLLIDIDPQAHTSVIFSPSIPKECTANDLFLNKALDIKSIIRKARIGEGDVENLFIIPSNIHLAITSEQIAVKTHREKLLHNNLKKVEKDFDFVLIDCPPALGVLTINAIYTADLIIIPTIYGKYSLDGIADLFHSIEEVKETKNYQYRILRNGFDVRNKLSNEFIDGQLEPFKDNLIKTIIRKNEPINQAQMNDEPVFIFDPKSKGSEDFDALTEEIINYVH
jgi:chromosome partitioning protein